MRIAFILLILIIMITLIARFAYMPQKYVSQPNTTSSIPLSLTPSPQQPLPVNWKILPNPNIRLSLSYPPEAKAEARTDESLVTFMGQKQIASGRIMTELFDGYAVRIGLIKGERGITFEELAKNERENAQTNCNDQKGQISQIIEVEVDKHPGYQYSSQGCYLDYTDTIVSFKNQVYRITQSYVGEEKDQQTYKTITNEIYSTLKFIEDN